MDLGSGAHEQCKYQRRCRRCSLSIVITIEQLKKFEELVEPPLFQIYSTYRYQTILLSRVSAAVASTLNFMLFDHDSNYSGRLLGSSTVKRTRLEMEGYIARLEDKTFRRKYRMDKAVFWSLLDLISPHLPNTGEKRKRGRAPNGPITHAARLSMVLRYFAGGDPLDIADIHGVNKDEPLKSVWMV